MAILISGSLDNINEGEKEFIESAATLLPNEFIIYHHREIYGREFDCALLIPNLGIIVVEIKGWYESSRIRIIDGDAVQVEYPSGDVIENPKRQARTYRFDMINYIRSKTGLSPLVFDMVAYPFISQHFYKKIKLDMISSEEFSILKDDLVSANFFLSKLHRAYSTVEKWGKSRGLNQEELKTVRKLFEPTFSGSFEMPQEEVLQQKEKLKSKKYLYSILLSLDSDVTDKELNRIMSSYINGTKFYVFVATDTALQRVIDAYTIFMKEKNEMMTVDNRSQKNRAFAKFNFFVYSLHRVGIPLKKLYIKDGKIENKSDEDLLRVLHNHTSFNFDQYTVEHCPLQKNIMIMASAGTGKTHSMISRISFLCYKHKYSYITLKYSISMLTFTNEAAFHMKEKLKSLFLNYYVLTKKKEYLLLLESVNGMNISTIHKYALDVIKQHGSLIGYGKNVTIASGIYERRNILEDCLDEYLASITNENPQILNHVNIDFYELKKQLLNVISRLYSRNIDVSNAENVDWGNVAIKNAIIHDVIRYVIPKTEKVLSKKLLSENRVHLHQLISVFNELAHAILHIPSALKVDYMFIDEFQDTDNSQIQALFLLQKSLGFHLFVVGDIKQCIYRFRGAETTAFRYINDFYGEECWLKYTLNKNYRSDNRLLSRYNFVCKQWAEKYSLLPYNDQTDRLHSDISFDEVANPYYCRVRRYTKQDFFKKLASCINDCLKEISIAANDGSIMRDEEKTIAILVRQNWQAEAIKNGLSEYGIKVNVKTGGRMYQSAPAIHFLKMLNALVHHQDPSRLAAFISSDYLDVKIDMWKLTELNERKTVSYLIDIIDTYFLKNGSGHHTFTQLIHSLRTEPVLKIIHIIINTCKPWLNDKYVDDEQNDYKINLNQIIDQIVHRYSIDYLSIHTIWQYMHICVTTGVEEQPIELVSKTPHSVVCMTIHKAKGLDFGYVLLPCTNNAIDRLSKTTPDITFNENKIGYCIPIQGRLISNSNYHARSEQKERSFEETRLLYVAMTRAIKKFIWFSKTDTDRSLTWENLLKGGLHDGI